MKLIAILILGAVSMSAGAEGYSLRKIKVMETAFEAVETAKKSEDHAQLCQALYRLAANARYYGKTSLYEATREDIIQAGCET